MTLSEKIYKLRKQSGYSQEHLAEMLGVSRQSVSKWETGASIPDSEKLVSISEVFGISLDYLMRDNESPCEIINPVEKSKAPDDREHNKSSPLLGTGLLGIIILAIGLIALVAIVIVFIAFPSKSNSIGESSMIIIDGNGILLTICIIAIILGVILIIKGAGKA